jgi:hypothetical protein
VVHARKGIPGRGFVSLARRHGREGDDYAIWHEERQFLCAVWRTKFEPSSDGADLDPDSESRRWLSQNAASAGRD